MNTSAPPPKRKRKNSLGENHYSDKVRKKEKWLTIEGVYFQHVVQAHRYLHLFALVCPPP
jgi:hypothetical protein